MPKTFWVEDGHDVLVGHVWYGPDVLVLVEPRQTVEVYYAPKGKRGACIGNHTYAGLHEDRPPLGLRRASDRE